MVREASITSSRSHLESPEVISDIYHLLRGMKANERFHLRQVDVRFGARPEQVQPGLRFLEGFLMNSMKCRHDNRAVAKLCDKCTAPWRIRAAEPTFADREVSARSNGIGRTHLMQTHFVVRPEP